MQALCYLLIYYASGAIGPTCLTGYGSASGTAEQMYSFSFEGIFRLLSEEELAEPSTFGLFSCTDQAGSEKIRLLPKLDVQGVWCVLTWLGMVFK